MTVVRRIALAAFLLVPTSVFAQLPCPPTPTAVTPRAPNGVNFAPGAQTNFTWTPENPNSLYHVVDYQVILEGANPTQLCKQPPTATGCVVALPTTLPNGPYSWHVQVDYRECTTNITVSPSASFTVGCLDGPAPTPLDPIDGAVNVPTRYALAWSTIKGADHYDVYFGVAGKGGCTTLVNRTTNTKFDPGPLQPGTPYEWRVVAVSPDKNCPGLAMACARFTTLTCPTTTDAKPLNPSGNNVPLNTGVMYTWNASTDATVSFYEAVVDGAVACSSTTNSPTSCSGPATGIATAGSHSWFLRVHFQDPGCAPLDTQPVSFLAGCLSPPRAIAPVAGAQNVPTSLTFQWADVSADQYDVYLAAGTACAKNLIGSTTKGITTLDFRGLKDSTQYAWTVVATKAGCPAVQMDCTPFTTAAPGCPTVADATPLKPVRDNLPLGTAITFAWSLSKDPSVVGYDVVTGDGTTVLCSTTNATTDNCTYFAGFSTPGPYDWGVRTNYKGCSSLLSAKAQFSVGCPTSAPTPVSPLPGDVNVSLTPTLTWSDVGAQAYDVILDVATNACGGKPVATIAGTSFTVPSSLVPGTAYAWSVVARSGNCPPQTMACSKFQTAGCPTDAATLVSPADGTTLTSTAITFTWKGVAGAAGYDVLASSDGVNFATAASTTGETSTRATATLPAGTYLWFVRTRFPAGCKSTDSAQNKFAVVISCKNGAPALLAPAPGETVTLPVKFAWTAVDTATSYGVFVLSSASAAPTLVGSTSSTSLASSSLPGGTYEWFVRAAFDLCPATESAHSKFAVKADATCPTDVALPLLPKDGQTDVVNPTHFEWRGPVSANVTFYRLIASMNGGTPTAIAETKDTLYDANLPQGKVEWYVETNFVGCPPTQSVHSTFSSATTTCPTNPGSATLIAPANGAASITSPVTFQWNGVAGATGYRVLASVDGGSVAVIATTATTQATVAVPQGKIVWGVETLFGDCPTTLSDKSVFTVSTPTKCDNVPASLVSPANGATVTSPVTFTWKGVAGGLKYQLFGAVNGGRFELLGITDGTSLERIAPTGTISWYVVTGFASCPEQKSDVFQFKVTEAKTCGAGKIELKSPSEGASVASPTTLSWSSSGADFHRVWISTNGDAPTEVARTTATSVTLKLPSGKIEWYVEGLFNNCPTSFMSGLGHFIVTTGANCAANQPATLVSPSGTVSGTSIDFRWNPSAGANAYRLWIAPAGEPFGDVGFTSDVHLTRELKPGKYEWFVESFFESCPTVDSQHATFAIELATPRCSDASPLLTSPADGSTTTDSDPTFLWSSVPNATRYRLFVAVGGADFKLIGETTDTSLTVSLPPGNITWYVETAFDQCASTDSSKARFTITRSTKCDATDAPLLVSPIDEATNVTSPVSFDWDAVSGGTSYVLFAKLGEDGATVLAETKDTFAQVRIPEGVVEWWIVAFRAGCDPIESKHFGFTTAATACPNLRPILQSPPENASGLLSPVHFSWTNVDKATGYKLWAEDDDKGASPIATTKSTSIDVDVPSGHIRWFVEAVFDGCPSTESASSIFDVIKTAPPCRTPDPPVITVPGEVVSDSAYTVRWYAVPNVNVYELEEAGKPDFSDATTKVVNDLSVSFTHTAAGTPVQYLYRVRGVSSCSEDRGPYSNVIGIYIIPPAAKGNASAEAGTPTNVVQTIFLPGSSTPVAFKATSDKPWVTITPSSGVVPPEGLTLVVTADPDALALGTNTGTILIDYPGSGKNGVVNGNRTTTSSVSVSLVTPVSSKGKNTPLPESLIIPAVAHTQGANGSLFESDIRIANTSAQTMRYQVLFTPSGVDGTQKGSSTTVQIDPGVTMALDDIMATFFGSGNDGKGVTGMMEIRPITTSTSTSGSLTSKGRGRTTVASSRTYNVTEKGTFGQFIPAVPYSQFIAKSATAVKTILSLQQISQSANYRTNFGLVEASGEPVSVVLSVFDDKNKKVGEIPVSLQASEHRQLNSLLATTGLSLEDGRVEVEVTSATGRVTAYASVVDNRTNDPLLVSPVLRNAEATSSRFVLPSIGDFDIGVAHWKSDVRLFNNGSTPAALTLSYYPQGNPGKPSTLTTTLQPGEVRAFDNFVEANFNQHSTAGSLVVTSAAPASIVATAKTYTASSAGTYGQFIPGVTPEQSIGVGDDALQILQIEQSSRFRTNIGVTETSGKPAVAEIAVIVPGSKTVPRIQIPLAANEFRQISLLDFKLGTIYNTRATVKVMSGTGTVTAYGSLIDQVTQDPSYVPAQ